MKKIVIILSVLCVFSGLIFNSCTPDDIYPPKIRLIGSDDTTVLLRSVYVDPLCIIEDNADDFEDIILETDAEDILSTFNDRISRAGDFRITYTATDQAGNPDTTGRAIRVRNITEPFVGGYTCNRIQSQELDDTTYRTTISSHTSIAGGLRIGKVYSHRNAEGQLTYFKINAFLVSDTLSRQYDSYISYLGTDLDPETPFFENYNFCYDSAVSKLPNFTFLEIPENSYEDSLGNVSVVIKGEVDPANDFLPKSRIEYVSGTNQVSRITLIYSVTMPGEDPDLVHEVYDFYY